MTDLRSPKGLGWLDLDIFTEDSIARNDIHYGRAFEVLVRWLESEPYLVEDKVSPEIAIQFVWGVAVGLFNCNLARFSQSVENAWSSSRRQKPDHDRLLQICDEACKTLAFIQEKSDMWVTSLLIISGHQIQD